MQTFDIVLIDDQSMDFVNAILRVLLSYESVKNQQPELQKLSVDNWAELKPKPFNWIEDFLVPAIILFYLWCSMLDM